MALIPAYQAAASVGAIAAEAKKHTGEVVVVDDGSSDGTGAAARTAGAVVLRHERNCGKGAALKTGFAWALENGAEAVITLDADGQHLPSEIPRFVEEYARAAGDLIIGSRRHLFHGMVRRRRLANRFSAWTISMAAGTPVPDSQSGFRLYSRRLLAMVPLDADGFDAESEVIVRASRAGLKIASVPIGLGFIDGVSTSHYRPLADTVRIAFRVVWTRVKTPLRRS